MFLNKLNTDEKVAFLGLAHYIARVDGDFSEDEKETIMIYCFEMQMEDIKYIDSKFNLDDTLNKFHIKEHQNILLLEIIALVYADGEVHIKEKEILDMIMKTFNIREALFSVYVEWSKAILAISEQGQALIKI